MMTSLKLRSMQQKNEEPSDAVFRLPTAKEQWLVTVMSIWFFGGLLLDGWAHNHIPQLESFFTPWHAAFYSGYLATAISFLLIVGWRMRKNKEGFFASIPVGYGAALIGAGTFVLGGIGDMVWHELFGIEANVEALVSPTHLVLACSMFLMVSANVRVWFKSTPPIGKPTFVDQLPMLFSISGTYSLLAFMMQFSHFAIMRARGTDAPTDGLVADMSHNIAITGYLLHVVLFMGCIFFIARRARLAGGAITFVLTLHMLAMAWMLDAQVLLPCAIVAGLFGDALLARAYPFDRHRAEFRAFAFLLPAILFFGYFLALHETGGIWWSVHLWTGSIVLAGFTGLLLSYLVLPIEE